MENTYGSGTIEDMSGNKIATDWAGEDDWSSNKKNKTSSADKTDFVTLVLKRMNLSTANRKVKGKGKGETRRL